MPVRFEISLSPSNGETHPAEARVGALDNQKGIRRIAACVDASGFAEKVIPHALAVAAALGLPVTFLRVLEVKSARAIPIDPVEWDIRLREAKNDVEKLVEARRRDNQHVEAEVIEGGAAEQISLWGRNHDVELSALCTHGDSGLTTWGLGSTAQKLLDRVNGSILLIPSSCTTADPVRYHRLLVPLDGSSHAESVLPQAICLARAERAELVLVHVVPIPELTEVGPLENEAIELRERLTQRNERVGEEYLDRIRARMTDGFSTRTLLLRDADVRTGLIRAIAEEAPDLVLVAAHGHARRWDVPFGSVTNYLIAHSSVPLLIVRRHPTHLAQREAAMAHHTRLRLPTHAQ